jgi:hypothetical protein
VAKLLNVAIAQGIDPHTFGGFDLVTTLTKLEQPSGRFSDVSQYGDNSTTFGQSFALIGLTRAGETVTPAARDFLRAQQCGDGGFRWDPNVAGCSSDADATAMAVQALIAVGDTSAAAADGLDYLAAHQVGSGGVSSTTQGVNANSTGLAGQAFIAAGRTAQARLATGYLTALQYGCGFPSAVQGGVAYDQASFDEQKAAGRRAKPVDLDRRSTAQALLALAGTPLASVTAQGSDAEAPALACSAGTTATPSPTASAAAAPTRAPTTPAAVAHQAAGEEAASTGSLAQTGTDLLLPAGLGLLLVAAGALAVYGATRRRGSHA